MTAWAGQNLIAKAGESRSRLLILMMSLVAGLTALISVNGAVAALLPVVVVMAVRLKLRTVAIADAAGVRGACGIAACADRHAGEPAGVRGCREHGMPPFSLFSFAIAGIPLIAGTIAIVVFFGQRLLPTRSGRSLLVDLSQHARTLVEQYRLDDGMFHLRIRASSPMPARPADTVTCRTMQGLTLVSVLAGDGNGPLRRPTLADGDLLMVRGDANTAAALAADMHLAFRAADAPQDCDRHIV